jgi:hypothetical protein
VLTHGTFQFTERSAALIMAEQIERNVDYPIDFDHLSLRADLPPEQRAAAGFCRLEMRGAELWLVNIRWTDIAAKLIAAGGYRYHSPVFNIDTETKEIIRYQSCAITNTPATHDCLQIAASAKSAKPVAASAPRSGLSLEQQLWLDEQMGIGTKERFSFLRPDGQFVIAGSRRDAILNMPRELQVAASKLEPKDLRRVLATVNVPGAVRGIK